jgi:hypothetical protein
MTGSSTRAPDSNERSSPNRWLWVTTNWRPSRTHVATRIELPQWRQASIGRDSIGAAVAQIE